MLSHTFTEGKKKYKKKIFMENVIESIKIAFRPSGVGYVYGCVM